MTDENNQKKGAGKFRADLHLHTYYSDGSSSPLDMVRAAKRNGVNLLAITDHDNCLALGDTDWQNSGVKVIEGEEISAYSGGVKVHILCYGINVNCPAFKEFNERLVSSSEERTADILEKLNAAGIKLSLNDVKKFRRNENAPLHGMYIAMAGMEKTGEESAFAFYNRYLGYGKIAYSSIGRPSPEEACETVRKCGGISSVAHPGRIILNATDLAELIRRLKGCGLNGIEAVYSGHNKEQTQYFKEMAEEFGLLVTGGSDAHSAKGNSRPVGKPLFFPDVKLLSALNII